VLDTDAAAAAANRLTTSCARLYVYRLLLFVCGPSELSWLVVSGQQWSALACHGCGRCAEQQYPRDCGPTDASPGRDGCRELGTVRATRDAAGSTSLAIRLQPS